MGYIIVSLAHFQVEFFRNNATGLLALLLGVMLLGACTQAELRGEGKEEAIFPGESATGRTIPYIPDPTAVVSPEAIADAEEAIFPRESATGRTVPYTPEPTAVVSSEALADNDEAIFLDDSSTGRTIPSGPDSAPAESPEPSETPEVFVEIQPESPAELPKIPKTAVVAVQTTTQKESLAILEEKIAPEEVLFPDSEEESIAADDMAVAIEEETVAEEEMAGIAEDEAAVAAQKEVVADETIVSTDEKSTLPQNMPFSVVELKSSKEPEFAKEKSNNSGEILMEDEEQTDFASEEMFVAVDEKLIPGASTNAVLTAAVAVADSAPPEQTDTDSASIPVVNRLHENAPGSEFGNILAFGGGLGGTGESTYPSKGEFGRYEPAPDPDNPPKGIFGGTRGISLFPNVSRQPDTEGRSNLSINSFLWRAALETLSFMPLDSADPFGGVIITDWHSNLESPNERFKVVTYILDSSLRVGALRVSVFRQERPDSASPWQDAVTDEDVHVQLENTILKRARELRLSWIEEQEN